MKSKTSNGSVRQIPWLGILFIFIAVGSVIATMIASAVRPLTTLEIFLFQLLVLGAGVMASLLLGRASAAQAGRDVIRPHARSALRQALVLRNSISRLSCKVREFRASGDDPRLDIIQTVIDEQIPMGRCSVENWRDIVQDEVDEVYKEWTENPMWRDADGSSD